MSNSHKVMKDGKMLHGNAATLHLAKKSGGMDQFIDEIVNVAAVAAAQTAVKTHISRVSRPALHVVNGGKK
ncbi:hypothetical protein FZI24_16470 [Cronobacter sakazakii]|nr:hypothetical protein FZI24_16470 [Cronobacter sakazakii]